MCPHTVCSQGVRTTPAHIQFKLDTFYHFLINPRAVRSHVKTHSGGRREKEKKLPPCYTSVICSELLIQFSVGLCCPEREAGSSFHTERVTEAQRKRQEPFICKTVKVLLMFRGSLIMSALLCFSLTLCQIQNCGLLIPNCFFFK